jgi:peptide/nickel transport system ATP-binding protein
MTTSILSVENLSVSIGAGKNITDILKDVSFSLTPGKTLGIVGESGCGKSMTALAVMGLLPEGTQASGQIVFDSRNLLEFSAKDWTSVRGARIAMVFQEPMTALNPVMTVGNQLGEMLIVHEGLSRTEARVAAIDLLTQVGIADPEARVDTYPHEMSGGMRQRVMIAMALACRPDILIADEPTTALDVSIESQILDLLLTLQQKHGMALLLISHNLAVISEMSDDVIVMYAGRVVESGPVTQVLGQPRHPYTRGLMSSIPDRNRQRERLPTIPGTVPTLRFRPSGCEFAARCPQVQDQCRLASVALRKLSDQHSVACLLS